MTFGCVPLRAEGGGGSGQFSLDVNFSGGIWERIWAGLGDTAD